MSAESKVAETKEFVIKDFAPSENNRKNKIQVLDTQRTTEKIIINVRQKGDKYIISIFFVIVPLFNEFY